LVKPSQRQLGQKGTKKALLGEDRAKGKRAKSRPAQAGTEVNGLIENCRRNVKGNVKLIHFCFCFLELVKRASLMAMGCIILFLV